MEENRKIKQMLNRIEDARLYRSRLKDYKWRELDAFDNGEQWDLKSHPSWLPRPVTNYINLVKSLKTASVSVENLTGDLLPLSPADTQMIGELNRVNQYLWEKLGIKYHVRDALESSRLLGTGITFVGWDESVLGGTRGSLYEGEIVVKNIDPSCFYPDPRAHTLEDCEFMYTAYRKPFEFFARHPRFKAKAEEIKQRLHGSGHEYGEIYNGRDYQSQQDEVLNFISYYYKDTQRDKVSGDEFTTWKVAYFANEVFLDERPVIPNECPFAVLYQHKRKQDFWGVSDAMLILDNQKLVNKIESISATIALMLQNPQKVVNKASGIDPRIVAKYGNAQGIVYESNIDPSQAIRYVEPPQLPASLLQTLQETKANIREIAGLNEAYMGSSVGSLQTSSGVNQLINRATLRDQDSMFHIEQYLERLTRLLMKYAVTYYTDNRLMRLKNIDPVSNQEFDYVQFVAQDYSDLDFDFKVDTYRKANDSRAQRREDAQNLIQWQLQFQPEVALITPEEIIKMYNIEDKEDILARMKNDRDMMSLQQSQIITQAVMEQMQMGIPPEQIQMFVQQILTGELLKEQKGGIGNVQQRQMG